jgi:beta-lactamase regulating signal transducer with metallopeptidase domain
MFRHIIAASIQGTIFWGLAWLAAWLLRRDAARSRYLTWVGVIIAQSALAILLGFQVPRLPEPLGNSWFFKSNQHHAVASARQLMALDGLSFAEPVRTGVSTASPTDHIAWKIATLMWFLGVGVGVLRLTISTLRLRRLSMSAQPFESGSWSSLTHSLIRKLEITRPVRVSIANASVVPATWGFVYPVIVLPDTAEIWSPEQREFILLHELIHVKRWDALIDLIVRIATYVFWFDPLIWWAAHLARTEREHACDEAVLRTGAVASSYAATLLHVERSMSATLERSPGLIAAFHANDLRRRIEAILTGNAKNSRLHRPVQIGLILTFPCLCLALAAMKPSNVDAHSGIGVNPNGCTIQKLGLVDVTLSVPDSNSVTTLGAQNDGKTVLAIFDGKSCPTAEFNGNILLSPSLDRIAGFSSPGSASFSFVDSNSPNGKRVVVTEQRGVLSQKFTIDGVEHPWSEGEQWFSIGFADLVRDYGYASSARVEALMHRGGIDEVLTECSRTRSDLGKQRLLSALLDHGPFSSGESKRIEESLNTIESLPARDALINTLHSNIESR